jgi:hypothetical protein
MTERFENGYLFHDFMGISSFEGEIIPRSCRFAGNLPIFAKFHSKIDDCKGASGKVSNEWFGQTNCLTFRDNVKSLYTCRWTK